MAKREAEWRRGGVGGVEQEVKGAEEPGQLGLEGETGEEVQVVLE